MKGAVPIEPPSEEETRRLLEAGQIVDGQRMAWGSNYTFLVHIGAGPGKYLRAVYKPRDGERPLWDFPRGTLYKREYAAYLLSRLLGWPDIPITLIRDGPYGVGSFQLYVDCDPEANYFNLVHDRADVFERFAVFDLLANNADRKAGHCLQDRAGRIWSIDHGLTFHPVFKLRTVMLEFWGRPIAPQLLDDLKALLPKLESGGGLADGLLGLLAPEEIKALKRRLQAILKEATIPVLDPYRNVPWPWV